MRLTRNERILNTFRVVPDPNSYGTPQYVVTCNGRVISPPFGIEEDAIAAMQFHQKWWLLVYRSREGLTDEQCVALDKLQRGEPPAFSTGICGSLTAGYGKCDEYGYFEYPLADAAAYPSICGYLSKYKHLLLNLDL